MSRPWSLARRLAWRLAAVMASAVIIAATAIAWRGWVALHDLRDAGLAQQAAMVSRALPPSDIQGSFKLPATLTARFRLSGGDNLFAVEDNQGRLVTASDLAKAQTFLPLSPNPPRPGLFELGRLPGHSHGMIGFMEQNGARWVLVLQGRDQADALADGVLARLMVAALYLLLPHRNSGDCRYARDVKAGAPASGGSRRRRHRHPTWRQWPITAKRGACRMR